MRAIPVPVRDAFSNFTNEARARVRSRSFSVSAWRRCAACASSFGSAARCSRRLIAVGATRCSPRSVNSGCKNCCPRSPMPRWPSWVPAWTAPSGLPRWICGYGDWVGSIKKTLVAAEHDRPDVAEKRARWHEQLAANPSTGLVFVDESGANTKMTRLRGRALGGRRLVARVPHGHYQTSTLISGVRLEGPCAPWLFEGPMNGEMFLAWVAARTGPHPATRRRGDPGQPGHTQNPGSARGHRSSGARGCCICRPIRRTSTPSNRCGARSNKSSAVTLRARRANCSRRPKPPFTRFPPPIAKASFLAPNTLHDLWKCFSLMSHK